MPRRSKGEADLNVVQLGLPQYTRPDPPPDLEPPAAETWRTTVAAMRPDHFHGGTHHLLKLYCRSAMAGEMIAAGLQRKSVDDPGYRRLLNLANAQSKTTLALARSLRLTPKSRRDPVDTRWQDRRKPWED
jgi:hypothetical protein